MPKVQKSEMLSALYALRAGLTVISAEKERAQALGVKADEDMTHKRVELAEDPAWEQRAKFAPDSAFRTYGDSAALYRDARTEYERKESGWEIHCLSDEPLKEDLKKDAKQAKSYGGRIALSALLLVLALTATGLGLGFAFAKLLAMLGAAGATALFYLLIISGCCIVIGVILGFTSLIPCHLAILKYILAPVFFIGAEVCAFLFLFLNSTVKGDEGRLLIYLCLMGAVAALFLAFCGLKNLVKSCEAMKNLQHTVVMKENYIERIAQGRQDMRKIADACLLETLKIQHGCETLIGVLRRQFAQILDVNYWQDIDLVIFFFEANRVVSMRAALLLTERERQTNRHATSVNYASTELSRVIKSRCQQLQNNLTQYYYAVSNEIQTIARSMEAQDIRLEGLTRYSMLLTQPTTMNNALLTRMTVNSSRLVDDATQLHVFSEAAETRRNSI